MKRNASFAAIGALVAALALMVGSDARAAGQDSANPTEYQLKGAFLYNFAKFVEWPAEKRDTDRQISVCIVGDDPFGLELDEMLKGRTANGRELVVRRMQDARDLPLCHIAFISDTEPERVERFLRDLGEQSVLTVGEAKQFAAVGGMINFVTEERKVRFEINAAAAEQRGLRISSKLLKLARIVR